MKSEYEPRWYLTVMMCEDEARQARRQDGIRASVELNVFKESPGRAVPTKWFKRENYGEGARLTWNTTLSNIHPVRRRDGNTATSALSGALAG